MTDKCLKWHKVSSLFAFLSGLHLRFHLTASGVHAHATVSICLAGFVLSAAAKDSLIMKSDSNLGNRQYRFEGRWDQQSFKTSIPTHV